jgi:hypothetical protein
MFKDINKERTAKRSLQQLRQKGVATSYCGGIGWMCRQSARSSRR